MQNHKSYRFLLLILAALLLFSGCKEDVSFILPAEAYEDTVLVSGTNPTSTPTTVPTEPTTAPTVETTVPTEPTTAPTEETTVPTEPTVAPTEPTTVPSEPPMSIIRPTEPAETQPQPTNHTHDYSKAVVDSTCTEKGYTKYTCSCGDSYTASYKDPLGHNYKVTVVEPTVNQRGYTLHECKRCGYSYKDNYTNKLPSETDPPAPTEHKHSYTKTVVAPTCTEKGYTIHTCRCGDSYKDSFKNPLGHTYKDTVVAPTVDKRGYTLHKCTRCNYSYKDNYTDKLPPETEPPAPTEHKHSYTKTVVAPTCTEKGYTKYTCACGDTYTDSPKNALGHDYKVTVVAPTVDSRGYNLHTCKRCGHSYKDNYVDKLPPHTDPPPTEPPQTEPPATDPPKHEVYDISDHVIGSLEYEILKVINEKRAEAGLGELKMDKKLCALAAIRAYESSISFSHTRPDGRSCFTVFSDYNYTGGSIAGENLLHASPGYAASKLVDVWMKSTSHKDNILTSSFTKAGLGIYYANGRMYVANLFAG